MELIARRKTTKWRVILEQDPETGDGAAWCPELAGCTSAGRTEQEALDNIREAIALCLKPDPIQLEAGVVIREAAETARAAESFILRRFAEVGVDAVRK